MVVASIIIPTYRRPDTLAPAIRSCLAQEAAEPYEIIVVDNNPDGSARGAVAEFLADGQSPVRYVAEPRPGISHARNTGIAAAQGRYLVFLDDDQRADPGWLAGHLATLRRFSAAVSFGPICPEFPPGAHVPGVARWRYVRDEGMPSGSAMPNRSPLLGSPGISNTAIDRENCALGDAPFDLAYGCAGGEDTLLFRQLLQRGCKMVWCAEAGAHETIPAARLTDRYLLRRAFNGGQVSASTWAALDPPARGKMIAVRAAGAAQAALFVLPTLVCRLARHPRWLTYAVQLAAGLGKVCCHPKALMPLYREDRRDPTRAVPLDARRLPAEQ